MNLGRSYDYEEKYPADDWGAELSSEARFYKTYVDESEVYDLDRIEAWRDALDVLLVFVRSSLLVYPSPNIYSQDWFIFSHCDNIRYPDFLEPPARLWPNHRRDDV